VRAGAVKWLSAVAFAALIVAVCLFRPGSTPLLPPCPFRALTGFYCPGCGSTRMLYLLLHGQPREAFAQNPLAMLLLPVAVIGLIRQLMPGGARMRPRTAQRWGSVALAVVVLFGVLRNIPARPFTYLAPGGASRQFSDGFSR